jgi:acyl-CoA thioester hydrolase
MIHQVRVIFGDTDQMGVVYYANYLRFFEAARAAYLRALGRSHADLDAWGVALPVVEAHCRYRRPSHYEDLLDIATEVTEVRPASLRFEYQILRDGTLLADGFTRHACVDAQGRPRAMPPELRSLIERAQGGYIAGPHES